jgi:hypothetical protein
MLAELLSSEQATDEVCREARDAFAKSGGSRALAEAFAAAAAGPEGPTRAALLWVEWLGKERDFRACDAVLATLRDRPAARKEALASYVRALRGASDKKRLAKLLGREREALRGDDFLWGLAGHALSLHDDAAAARWLADWRSRRTSPWVLNATVLALRMVGEDAQAVAASRHALTLERDHTTDCHRAWLAVEEAIDGRVEAAEELARDVEAPEDCRTFYQGLVELVQAVLVVRRAGSSDRDAALAEARRHLAAADHRCAGSANRHYRRLRARAVNVIARERGGFRGWLFRITAAGSA